MAASEKQNVALVSMAASALLAGAKFLAAMFTGSLGILSEAIHSVIDFGATIVTYLALRVSDRPADDQHHYGHAKVESVAALVERGRRLPGAITFGSNGVGSLSHLVAQVMASTAGAEFLHVPFTGAAPASLGRTLYEAVLRLAAGAATHTKRSQDSSSTPHPRARSGGWRRGRGTGLHRCRSVIGGLRC